MDKERIEQLAAFAEEQADGHLKAALSWSELGGLSSTKDDLIKAGALYRARDVLREKL